MKHYLITGAAGFIGSQLTEVLLNAGHYVTAIDNFSLGTRAHIAAAQQSPSYQMIEADLVDTSACIEQLRPIHSVRPIDEVWHLAANSDISAGVSDSSIDLRNTFLTTHSVLAAMKELGIKRLAFSSTSAVYGVHDGAMSEDIGPLFPISNYGAMKLASEAAISAALESYLERVWIFRFPNVVGPRATHGAIFDFISRLRKNPEELVVLGDGTQQKPYLHVSELLEAMIFITTTAQSKMNYFNIGPSDTGATVKSMAESVVKHLGGEANIRYTGGDRGWVGDVPRFYYSVAKLEALGWKPSMDSAAALDRAIQDIIQEIQ
jgi:UDP-glucose 4-epimerase